MDTFSNNLKFLRKEKKLTQKDLASHLGIHVNAYQKYEYGTREPDLATIKEIANFFNVPTDFLLGNGVFSNFEDALKHKTEIVDNISKILMYSEITKNLSDNIAYINVLNAIISKIEYKADEDTLYINFFLNSK